MKRRGFTLIELMIVLAILGIIIAAVVPYFSKAFTEARVEKVEIQQVRSSIPAGTP